MASSKAAGSPSNAYFAATHGALTATTPSRNLGATAATWEGHGTSTTSAGLLHYQYGRVTPFPATIGNSPTIASSQQSFAWAVKNPVTYITYWSSQDNSTSYLWADKNVEVDSDGKSIFDPSPIGWRLPINDVWSDFPANCTAISDNVGTYTLGSTGTAKYYTTGQRLHSDGKFSGISSTVRIWSSIASTTSNAYYLSVTSPSNNYASYNRAAGFPVRPVRE